MRHVYERALTIHGRVLEIRDNHLVEVTAEGEVAIICPVAPSRPIKPGTKIYLKVKPS